MKPTLLGCGGPRPRDLSLVRVTGEVIKVDPGLLLELKGMALVRHSQIVAYGVSFLKKLLMLESIGWRISINL